MDKVNPTLRDLFKQLGLPCKDADIHAFIEHYKPIPETIKLHEMPSWTTAQATLLDEAIKNDSDWSYVADALDTLLRM